MATKGTIVLLGGGEVGDAVLGTALLGLVPGPRIAILPMASAFEHPETAVVEVGTWLQPLGAEVEGLMASSRADADLPELAKRLDEADGAYLTDGSALHLRTTLKATMLFDRLSALVERGGVLIASGEAATVLCDPMVDPRGGAPTVGLGPIRSFTVVPHVGADKDDPRAEKLHRTVALAPADLSVVSLPAGTALVCRPDGSYDVLGDRPVEVHRAGKMLDGGVESLTPWNR